MKGRFKCVACLDEKEARKHQRRAFREENPNEPLPAALEPRKSKTAPPKGTETKKPRRERKGSRANGTNPRAMGTNPRAQLKTAKSIIDEFAEKELS